MTNPPQDGDQPGEPGPLPVQPWRPSPFPASGPPPYPGPLPIGPPVGAPAQKSHVGLIAAVTALLVALIAGATALVLALESTVLDRAAVERDVAAQFAGREGVTIDLSCPARMEVTAHAAYDCHGITADDEQVTLRITITDEHSAAYTWTEP
jgi:hypothetical protein